MTNEIESRMLAEEIVNKASRHLKDAPEGTLRLSQSNNYLQFYHCTEENKQGKYIIKGNGAVRK